METHTSDFISHIFICTISTRVFARRRIMPKYKIDGAKFGSMDELKESLWEMYSDRMSQAEFDEYVQNNTVEIPD
jgi:hypothetical protein